MDEIISQHRMLLSSDGACAKGFFCWSMRKSRLKTGRILFAKERAGELNFSNVDHDFEFYVVDEDGAEGDRLAVRFPVFIWTV